MQCLRLSFIGIFTITCNMLAGTLPGKLTPFEIQSTTKILGVMSSTKLLRSAEPYRDLFPAIRIGLEFNLLFTDNLERYGDQTGNVSQIVPQPRLQVTKSLPWDLEVGFNFFPTNFANTVTTIGGSLKWAFYTEDTNALSLAAYGTYTEINGFSNKFNASTLEFGAMASKDWVRIRPYLGVGAIFSHGSVDQSLVQSAINTASLMLLHSFLGIEINLPVDLAIQIDLFDLSPSGSFLVGKSF